MIRRLTFRTLVLTAALSGIGGLAALHSIGAIAGAGPKGHSHGNSDETAYGKPGDPRQKNRIVEIVMKDGDGKMWFEPSLIKVKKGEQIRLRIKNAGVLDHEIVVATLEENLAHAKEMEKNPDMEHDDPNAKRLKPNGTGDLLWRFTKAGKFDMSCLIPGHRGAGMTGMIVVE